MTELINELFDPHIDLCKQTLNQIIIEWGHSTVALKKWLSTYHPEKKNKEYSRKADINADAFLPYRKNSLWSGDVAITRLKLAVKAKVIIIFSNPELSELEQKDIYVTECLRLWCRINSLTTNFTYNQFKDLLNSCYNEVNDNWEETITELQNKQENFKFKRKQTLYHYSTEDFDNIQSYMTLNEAYQDWLTIKFPYLLERFRYKKIKEFGVKALINEWSDEFKEYKYNQLKSDLNLVKIKQPNLRAFAKLLKVHNIEYKHRNL